MTAVRSAAARDGDTITQHLSAMLSATSEGVAFADANNVIVEANETFGRLFGNGTLRGTTIENLTALNGLSSLIAGKIQEFRATPTTTPFSVQRPVGQDELLLRMQPQYEEQSYNGVVISLSDITDYAQARRTAETAEQLKTEFLATISHEVRTPLSSIMGMLDLVLHGGLRDDSLPHGCVDTGRDCGSRPDQGQAGRFRS